MKTTTNYGLKKPEGTDAVDIADFNENADIIDNELAKKIDRTGAVSDMTVNFTQSGNRVNLTPGEKISTAFGKISKFFVDLKTVAFTGNYIDLVNRPTIPSGGAANKGVANNCTTNVDGFVLDARQGKNLQDQVNVVNSNLGNCFVDSTKITQEITFPYIANRDVILAGDVWLKNGDSRVGFDVNGNRIHNYRNQTPGDMQMPVFIALKKGNVLNIGYTMGSYTTHINEW